MKRAARFLAVVALLCSASMAHAYPTQPIRMIIPFPAGGPHDQIARPLAQKLSEAMGQPFVVENRAGANGLIGAGVVAKAEPDGHTVLFMSGSMTANPSIVAKMPFDPLADFSPITQVAATYGMMLVVRNDFPAPNLAEFVKMAKAQPGKYTYGNAGIGNPTHVSIELFKSVAGVDILSVPYKGTSETLPALLGGQIDLVASSTTVGTPYLRSGQMRALGITGASRPPSLPEVPTFAEQGYPDVVLTTYFGMWFPAGAPRDRVNLMHREVKKALETAEMRALLATIGLRAVASTPQAFDAFLKEDIVYQAKVNKRIGITPK